MANYGHIATFLSLTILLVCRAALDPWALPLFSEDLFRYGDAALDPATLFPFLDFGDLTFGDKETESTTIAKKPAEEWHGEDTDNAADVDIATESGIQQDHNDDFQASEAICPMDLNITGDTDYMDDQSTTTNCNSSRLNDCEYDAAEYGEWNDNTTTRRATSYMHQDRSKLYMERQDLDHHDHPSTLLVECETTLVTEYEAPNIEYEGSFEYCATDGNDGEISEDTPESGKDSNVDSENSDDWSEKDGTTAAEVSVAADYEREDGNDEAMDDKSYHREYYGRMRRLLVQMGEEMKLEDCRLLHIVTCAMDFLDGRRTLSQLNGAVSDQMYGKPTFTSYISKMYARLLTARPEYKDVIKKSYVFDIILMLIKAGQPNADIDISQYVELEASERYLDKNERYRMNVKKGKRRVEDHVPALAAALGTDKKQVSLVVEFTVEYLSGRAKYADLPHLAKGRKRRPDRDTAIINLRKFLQKQFPEEASEIGSTTRYNLFDLAAEKVKQKRTAELRKPRLILRVGTKRKLSEGNTRPNKNPQEHVSTKRPRITGKDE